MLTQKQLDEWEEACSWIYCGYHSELDKEDTHYTFYIQDNRLYYYYITKPNKITRWVELDKYSPDTLFTSYIKVRRKQKICGPVQPPPSPIVVKIRAMYKRRKDLGYVTV